MTLILRTLILLLLLSVLGGIGYAWVGAVGLALPNNFFSPASRFPVFGGLCILVWTLIVLRSILRQDWFLIPGLGVLAVMFAAVTPGRELGVELAVFGTIFHFGFDRYFVPYPVVLIWLVLTLIAIVAAVQLQNNGLIRRPSDLRFLGHFDLPGPINRATAIYIAMVLATAFLALGPIGDVQLRILPAIVEAFASPSNSFASVAPGTSLVIGTWLAMMLRSSAALWLIVIYALASALPHLIQGNILPDLQAGWRSLVRNPLIVGVEIAAIAYLVRQRELS